MIGKRDIRVLMNCERNERATNRSVFADVEPTNLRWERANFTVQTMPWLAILVTFVLQHTDSDRRWNFWRIANRILPPLCKSNANCCIVWRKDVLETESSIYRSGKSFLWQFLPFLSSCFPLFSYEFQVRRVWTNYLIEMTKYEISSSLCPPCT